MDRITAARVLIETVERGSAAAAAEALGMSRAMASRYIASIEDWSGTRLLHRTTRQLSLTSAGERVMALCRDIIRIADAVSDVAADSDTPRGRLRMTAPSLMAETLLISLLAKFAVEFPHIEVELFISDRTVDLVQDRIDMAIRITNYLDPSLIARRLGTCKSSLYASPAYLNKYGRPKTVEDLRHHRCQTYTNIGGTEWRLCNHGRDVTVEVGGGLKANDALAVRRATLEGMGISMLPHFGVAEDVRQRRLEVVLADWQPEKLGIHAVFVSRRHLPMATRLLIDYLARHMDKE